MSIGWRERIERIELSFLLGTLGLVVLLFGFAELSDLVVDGRTQAFDDRLLLAMRRASDPTQPVGPLWLKGAALDLTALGSFSVLTLVVVGVVGFLALQGMGRTALFVLAASIGGWLLNTGLKELFQRPRPDIVPHLQEVASLSFPSGHAMSAAAVYLTLGALLMRIAQRRATKVFCITMGMVVTFLVGSSRVYLGVHYPTDVLGGWLGGLSWAVICWMVESRIAKRAGLRREQQQALESRSAR